MDNKASLLYKVEGLLKSSRIRYFKLYDCNYIIFGTKNSNNVGYIQIANGDDRFCVGDLYIWKEDALEAILNSEVYDQTKHPYLILKECNKALIEKKLQEKSYWEDYKAPLSGLEKIKFDVLSYCKENIKTSLIYASHSIPETTIILCPKIDKIYTIREDGLCFDYTLEKFSNLDAGTLFDIMRLDRKLTQEDIDKLPSSILKEKFRKMVAKNQIDIKETQIKFSEYLKRNNMKLVFNQDSILNENGSKEIRNINCSLTNCNYFLVGHGKSDKEALSNLINGMKIGYNIELVNDIEA